VRMWTLPRACAWACAWACSLRRGGGRAHVDFAEGLRVGMRVGMFGIDYFDNDLL
jgi:hypothetical protein